MTPRRDQTLAEWLFVHESVRPDAPALIAPHETVSFGALAADARRLASGLADLGVGPGDVVAAQDINTRAYVAAFLATALRGGVFQTLHMPYRRKELAELLKDSGAKAVFAAHEATAEKLNDLVAAAATAPARPAVIADADGPGLTERASLYSAQARPQDIAPARPDDRYLLLYTSGTTSTPKGAPHAYRNFLNNAWLAGREMGVTATSRVLSLAAMTHLYGLFTLHMALATGAATALAPAFRPDAVMADIARARPSHIYAAPAHFAPVAAAGGLDPGALGGVRLVCLSGAAASHALAAAIERALPDGSVVQLWGMSELQAGAFGRPDDPIEKRLATAGRAAPGAELRIVDDADAPLPPGREGALQARGPSVFKGYLNRADETDRAFTGNGWFRTGDLARLDADGYLTLTGRTKEIINRGGVKYNPAEVESVAMEMPSVVSCAVVAEPDPDLGERGCLCVQLRPGADLTLDEVRAALAGAGLAKFKWPERLMVLRELPMTPTRKVKKGELAALIQTAAAEPAARPE